MPKGSSVLHQDHKTHDSEILAVSAKTPFARWLLLMKFFILNAVSSHFQKRSDNKISSATNFISPHRDVGNQDVIQRETREKGDSTCPRFSKPGSQHQRNSIRYKDGLVRIIRYANRSIFKYSEDFENSCKRIYCSVNQGLHQLTA